MARRADVASASRQAAEAWPRASCAGGAAGSREAATHGASCLGAACPGGACLVEACLGAAFPGKASRDEACLGAVACPGAFRGTSQGETRGVAEVDHRTAADDPATSPGRGSRRGPRGRGARRRRAKPE